eukprot:scaffold265242_cov13-Tisochrysis_lutea.AAC.1
MLLLRANPGLDVDGNGLGVVQSLENEKKELEQSTKNRAMAFGGRAEVTRMRGPSGAFCRALSGHHTTAVDEKGKDVKS